jgi:hypothetical protein
MQYLVFPRVEWEVWIVIVNIYGIRNTIVYWNTINKKSSTGRRSQNFSVF